MSVFKLDTSRWHVVRIVFLLASVLIFTSLALTFWTANVWWLAIAGFVALMQMIFAFTGYCLAAIIIDKLGASKN